MSTFFKAVRHDYGSFHDPSLTYGPVGTTVTHPKPITGSSLAAHHLSVSTVPTDCTGFQWRVNGKDSRLLAVEPLGEVWTPAEWSFPRKRAVTGVRVVDELPIREAFGPQGEALIAYLTLLPTLTQTQWDAVARDAARDAARKAAWRAARDAAWSAARSAAWSTAWSAAWSTAWSAAWDAARSTARSAAWSAAWDAARDAARSAAQAAAWSADGAAEAIIVRDLISDEHFRVLTAPMRAAGVDFDRLRVTL